VNNENILLSVFMITYNHERFIGQAIESVLMQKTNFDFEIVIGEDGSKDRTKEIVLDYASKYPEIIKPIIQEKNVGMFKNASIVRARCKGKYVAILEGDDYWIDPLKLQKQVDFLEKHPECVICHTRAIVVNEDGNYIGSIIPSIKDTKKFSNIEDQLTRNVIRTLTSVYRSGYVFELPDFAQKHWAQDWIMHIINAQYGLIGFITDITAAYRSTTTGMTNSKNNIDKIISKIKTYKELNIYLDYKYNELIQKLILREYAYLSKEYGLIKNKKESIRYLKMCFNKNFYSKLLFKEILKEIVAFLCPTIYKLMKILLSKKSYYLLYLKIKKKMKLNNSPNHRH